MRSFVIHGHFYQPPRENPWTGEIEREPGAEPFPDWNARIFHECYRANAHGRITDDAGRLERLVNNYAHISFNFGPTLLQWMARHHPATVARIVEADRESARRRGGHGNAIAQAYNHAILPLCHPQDRATQIRWGLADFRHRFGRESEGLWLPETAADHATLDALIDAGVRFTIRSPYQAGRVRRLGGGPWRDASGGRVDPTLPYRYLHRDGSGRSLAVIFYDGPRSRAIAFEGALGSSQAFVGNLARADGGEGPLVSVATDGESYGHHGRWGDRTLAHALEHEARRQGLHLTNHAEVLDRVDPRDEVELWLGPDGRGSSWSCAHGVGRWYRDCGCHTGGREGWNQAWRTPLREALDDLRAHAAAVFEGHGGDLFVDPWAARDAYVDVLLGARARGDFLGEHCRRPPGEDASVIACTLLELSHAWMLAYTSCGWFFSDISGIETRQVLRYAGRVMDHLEALGHAPPRERLLERLGDARSNVDGMGSGADVYRRFVEPARVTPRRIAAHLAMSALVDESEPTGELASHDFDRRGLERRHHGQVKLAVGAIALRSRATGGRHRAAVAAMHLGGVDFFCVVREGLDDDSVRLATARLTGLLTSASLPTILRAAYASVGQEEYGLEHLLPGGAERIASTILSQLVDRFSEAYAGLYEDNRRTLDLLASAGMSLPRELGAAVEFTLGRRFEEEIARQGESQDPEAYRRAIVLAEEIAARGWQVDRSRSQALFERMIERQVEGVLGQPVRERLEAAVQLLVLAGRLRLAPDLTRPQERLYDALSDPEGSGVLRALARGEAGAPGLTALVERLVDLLRIAPGVVGR